MSHENVEVAKRFVDAFNRRDLNALMDTATPDVAFSPALAGTIDDNRFQGREGMRAYFADVDSAWEEFRLIVDEYRDLGDRVLTLGRLEGRGRGSGAAVDTPQGPSSRRAAMQTIHTPGEDGGLESGPHFTEEAATEPSAAWEEIEAGRFMPRRTRGSYRGRALG